MRHVLLCLLLLSAAPAVVAAPAPFVKPDRTGHASDVARMQGAWMTVEAFSWGKNGWNRLQYGGRWIVTGERSTWYDRPGSQPIHERFRLHPRTTPKGIDFSREGSDFLQMGVYSIEGDVLTLVLLNPREGRPESFARGKLKLVLRRSK
jgi:uncharacterized protein (TIGR03067 family)